MRERPKVVGLGGSLSPGSTSLSALKLALEGAAQAGAQTKLLDVRELDLPMYGSSHGSSHGASHPPEVAVRMSETIYGAHGLLWSSPLYHGTVSGSFKNALDWLQLLADRDPPYLTDKVIGLISTAGGVQGLQAVNTMEFIVRALRGLALPLVVPVARAGGIFDAQGRPRDAAIEQQLRLLGQEVADICIRRRPH